MELLLIIRTLLEPIVVILVLPHLLHTILHLFFRQAERLILVLMTVRVRVSLSQFFIMVVTLQLAALREFDQAIGKQLVAQEVIFAAGM